jgi:hypothetical protein
MTPQAFHPRGPSKAPTRDELENRPYVYRPFPACLHHPDGRSVEVKSEAEVAELGEPWRAKPFPPKPVVVAPPEPTLEELKTTIQTLSAENAELKRYCAEQALEIAEARSAAKPDAETKSGKRK